MLSILSAPFVILPGAEIKEDYAVVYDSASGTIVLVAPRAECLAAYPAAVHRHRRDAVISPGFINAHMHLYGVLAHGITPPVPILSFKGFLEDYWWPLVENLLDAPMIAAAARASSLELIDSGVTCLCDVLEAPLASGGLEAEAKVLGELGLRAVLSTEACERISREAGERGLAENALFIQSRKGDARIGGMLCTHTSFTCSQPFMEYALSLARRIGADLQFHLNESRYEVDRCLAEHGVRSAEWYDSIGVLGPNILAAQGVQLSVREIELLRDRKVRMVHVPLSNCEVGGGVSPVPELLAAGIPCGLGTDGYINDFFELMRGAFLIHKGHRENPALMDARTVWWMATEGGADAVYGADVVSGAGRAQTADAADAVAEAGAAQTTDAVAEADAAYTADAVAANRAACAVPDDAARAVPSGLGRLRKGAPADMIVIDIADLPTPANPRNLLDQLILFRKGSHVTEVFVGGRAIKDGGRLLTGDLVSARSESRVQALRLWAAGKELADAARRVGRQGGGK